MSIFYPDPKPNTEFQDKNGADDRVLAVFAVVLILAAGGYKIERAIAQFGFKHFETICVSIYAIIAVGLAVAAYFLTKRTRALEKRVSKLKSVWNPWAGILAARTTRGSVDLFVPEKTRCGHTQIIAATGRGKTQSVIVPWMVRDIADGHNVILLDGKGDPEIAQRIHEITAGFPNKPEIVVFDLGNPETSCTTNPLAAGSPQQIVDRIFTAFEFKDEYYEAVQYDIAGAAVELIQEVDATDAGPGQVTFKRLYEVLTDPNVLTELIGKSQNGPVKQLLMREFLAVSAKDRPGLIKGLVSQLGPFATREVAGLVNGPCEGKPYCSVSQAILPNRTSSGQKVFIFLIPTLKYQKLGHQLGKLLMQEIGWAVGERASRMDENAPFTPVYFDEFSAFAYEGFENILNKARSSRVALHLSHQAIGDFTKISDSLAEVINVNTNIKCLLGLNDPETAEFFARHIGTSKADKLTERAHTQNFLGSRKKTGEISMREVEEFVIHPNSLKNYMDGQGVLHMPGPKGNITEEVQFLSLEERELKSWPGGAA